MGFNIPPSLYANGDKRYVVLLTGSVKGENLLRADLHSYTYSCSEIIGQNFEDGKEVKFEILLNLQCTQNDYDRYVYIQNYPKKDGEDIKIEYNITRYCVFEYKKYWSINDYIKCFDEGSLSIPNTTSKDVATEAYVNETIEKLKSQSASQSYHSPYSGNFEWDVNMIINYGQSLSVGGGAALPVNDFRNALSFPGGISEWAAGLDIDDPKQVTDKGYEA